MKLKMKPSNILLLTTLLMPLQSFAHGKEMKDSPCRPLYDACEAAGFVKGDAAPTGKDLWDDCKKPLIDGKTVAGVSVDQSDINKCKKFKESKKQWIKKWEKNND